LSYFFRFRVAKHESIALNMPPKLSRQIGCMRLRLHDNKRHQNNTFFTELWLHCLTIARAHPKDQSPTLKSIPAHQYVLNDFGLANSPPYPSTFHLLVKRLNRSFTATAKAFNMKIKSQKILLNERIS